MQQQYTTAMRLAMHLYYASLLVFCYRSIISFECGKRGLTNDFSSWKEDALEVKCYFNRQCNIPAYAL